ncbi:unnamed protein product [Amoebophrya sp. A25]|nr:unnamed protein product [Amoebophrya sp. A25]|eukprot:GSA25T00015060001.1
MSPQVQQIVGRMHEEREKLVSRFREREREIECERTAFEKVEKELAIFREAYRLREEDVRKLNLRVRELEGENSEARRRNQSRELHVEEATSSSGASIVMNQKSTREPHVEEATPCRRKQSWTAIEEAKSSSLAPNRSNLLPMKRESRTIFSDEEIWGKTRKNVLIAENYQESPLSEQQLGSSKEGNMSDGPSTKLQEGEETHQTDLLKDEPDTNLLMKNTLELTPHVSPRSNDSPSDSPHDSPLNDSPVNPRARVPNQTTFGREKDLKRSWGSRENTNDRAVMNVDDLQDVLGSAAPSNHASVKREYVDYLEREFRRLQAHCENLELQLGHRLDKQHAFASKDVDTHRAQVQSIRDLIFGKT